MLSIHSDQTFYPASIYDLPMGDMGKKLMLCYIPEQSLEKRWEEKSLKMPGGSDIQDWFKSLPIFTRYWFVLSCDFKKSLTILLQVWPNGSLHHPWSVFTSQSPVVDSQLGDFHHKV